MELIRIIEQRKYQRGPHHGQEGGGAPLLGAPPVSWGPWWPSGAHLLLYEGFYPGKNRGQAYGTKLRRHEAEPWRNQSRALTELFCRGHFPPGGGNHHQRSSHRESAISINIFTSTISSQNPSLSLVSNLCIQTSDWYMWVASSVDYSL